MDLELQETKLNIKRLLSKNKKIVLLIIFILFVSGNNGISQDVKIKITLVNNDSTVIRKLIGNTFVSSPAFDNLYDIDFDSNQSVTILKSEFKRNRLIIKNYSSQQFTCDSILVLFNGFPNLIIDTSLEFSNDTTIFITYPASKRDICNRVCPKCKKSDLVQPVVFGFPIENPVTKKANYENYYNIGCEVRNDILWHCKRDMTNF